MCWMNDSHLRESISYTWGKKTKPLLPPVFSGRAEKGSALMKKSQLLAKFPIHHVYITCQYSCLEKISPPKAFSASKHPSSISSTRKSAVQLGWGTGLILA